MILRRLERRLREGWRGARRTVCDVAFRGALALDPVGSAAIPPPARPRRVVILGIERLEQLVAALPTLDAVAGAPEIRLTVTLPAPLAQLVESRRSVAQVLALHGRPDARSLARRLRLVDADLALDLSDGDDVRAARAAFLARVPVRIGASGSGREAFLIRSVGNLDDAPSRGHGYALLAREAGADPGPVPPALRIPVFEMRAAAAMLRNAGAATDRTLAALHPGGSRLCANWPVERFAEVARRIAETQGASVVVVGAIPDRERVERVAHLAGRAAVALPGVDVRRLAAILATCDLMVSGETGALLLAEAVGTPAVALVGPQDPRWLGANGPLRRVLRLEGLPCSPCERTRCRPQDCLLRIHADEVVQACHEFLEPESGSGRELRRREGA